MDVQVSALGWGVGLIVLPLAGALLAFVARPIATGIGITAAVTTVVACAGLVHALVETGAARYPIGGWDAPLGIALTADGLSLLMLLMTAAVGLAVSLYAPGYFRGKTRQLADFWPLWLFLWAGLNGLYLSGDLFNLYVTLELVGLASVALAALAGGADALTGAMRYLLVSLVASLFYLLGIVLLYHGYGSLDIVLLAERVTPSPPLWAALGLITAGLLLKTALFPLHFWLPPAHASAAAPVSALLSALVVKGSFYLLLRLWLTLFGDHAGGAAALLGLMGAAAVLWGSLQALRQTRLKLLIAYSTVAQLGYLFLAFPLASAGAWSGAIYLAISHALAKAAMFLAAGNILMFGGHDRIADLDRVAQRLPLSLAAFALGGISIMGLPPSGGFVGKWLLLEEAINQGAWGWVLVLMLGGLLAVIYVFKVIGYAFTQAERPQEPHAVPLALGWIALLLGLGAVLLGAIATAPLALLDIGDPFGGRWGHP
jgi:formate hydrogenlyase subunit 3/multisubunit Na+/H+ antiporter MnhD subunit